MLHAVQNGLSGSTAVWGMAERQASKKRTAISSAAGERSPRKGGVKRSQPRTKSLPGRERSNKRLPSEHEADAQDNASPKAARLSKDLGIKKVLRTPSTPTSRIASATPSNASPTPAAAICTSKRERINVNYDMRYHPAGKSDQGCTFFIDLSQGGLTACFSQFKLLLLKYSMLN